MNTMYLTILGRGSVETLDAYLYAHSDIQWFGMDERANFAAIVSINSDDPCRARYLADYQAGRCDSGLMGAKVFESLSNAFMDLRGVGWETDSNHSLRKSP